MMERDGELFIQLSIYSYIHTMERKVQYYIGNAKSVYREFLFTATAGEEKENGRMWQHHIVDLFSLFL